MRLASSFGLSLVIMLALATPLFFVAGRSGRWHVVRRFVLWATAMAALVASIQFTSTRLVERCMAVGNTQCVDYGGSGARFMVIAGFGLVALLRARSIVRPF